MVITVLCRVWKSILISSKKAEDLEGIGSFHLLRIISGCWGRGTETVRTSEGPQLA